MTALKHKDRLFTVRADFALVREIESELGSIAALRARLHGMSWEVSELVALTHMMLQAAGETVDYLALGNHMVRSGLAPYLRAAQSFLDQLVPQKEAA